MRIVVMGTGPFAVPTCRRLLADGHEIPLVVVRPLVDPTAKKLPPTPVRDWAKENGLTIFEPQSINDPAAIAELERYSPELFFVCDYGQILSKPCLSVPRLGGINLHGSLLPRHRGAAPVQWALLRGDSEAGVSVIHMTPRLDGGPILTIASTKILPDENAGQLEPRLAELGVEASMQAIEQLSHWDGKSEIGIVQTNEGITKAPRFAKSHGQLDFRLPAEYLVRLIRALQPWPGTFAELQFPDGKQVRLLVRSARAVDHNSGRQPGEVWPCNTQELGLDSDSPSPGTQSRVEPGSSPGSPRPSIQVSSEPPSSPGSPRPCTQGRGVGGEGWGASWHRVLAVATVAGTLLIARLQPAGKREMDAEEFLRGHSLLNGVHFILSETMLTELQ